VPAPEALEPPRRKTRERDAVSLVIERLIVEAGGKVPDDREARA